MENPTEKKLRMNPEVRNLPKLSEMNCKEDPRRSMKLSQIDASAYSF